MKISTAALLALLTLPAAALAQAVDQKNPPPQPPLRKTPVASAPRDGTLISGAVYLGELAPDFELEASKGPPLKLSATRGHWILLAFSDRKEHLAPLGQILAPFDSAGIELLGVCREKTYVLKGFVERDRVRFRMLSDLTGEISAMYGLYDRLHSSIVPGFFVLDLEGRVRLGLLGRLPAPKEIAILALDTKEGPPPEGP
ncbi:MAG: hypothetical protein A2W00_11340 [Candidatus Eisenbacteria bacterium RBG_16_71_46]|nr:MAG: hypothetical protein A2W00_11340 [Candidatus Eisenbacteria bacterium RBG_16_71_46]OGF21702.1 MAG: hypothetical protein A2V63_12845 [Candidatus Eisenbacteria bacterium RBG_19FT_COMBO_70_11]